MRISDWSSDVCSSDLLERAGKERLLADRLVRELGVDAARSEEQQLLDLVTERCLDDVRLDHQVLVEKVRRIGVVRENSADLRGRENDRIRQIGRAHV